MQKEQWKEVIGYEGLYQVSNLGNVKSLGNNKYRKDKILKKGIVGGKYYRFILSKDGKPETFRAHQLVAMAFLGHKKCGYKLVINHINFDGFDNRVENLEIVTQRENTNKKHIKSSSKYVGVHWSKKQKKWRAEIIINAKKVSLGSHKTELEAHQAYQSQLDLL
tara:strand:+ start:3019 stop:3510 length:492 start_codon:yes stop_codon:yes gene_type:complete